MCLYAKYLAKMTQVSGVAPGPLVITVVMEKKVDLKVILKKSISW
jgi:hypothetical protein